MQSGSRARLNNNPLGAAHQRSRSPLNRPLKIHRATQLPYIAKSMSYFHFFWHTCRASSSAHSERTIQQTMDAHSRDLTFGGGADWYSCGISQKAPRGDTGFRALSHRRQPMRKVCPMQSARTRCSSFVQRRRRARVDDLSGPRRLLRANTQDLAYKRCCSRKMLRARVQYGPKK